jgi:hypothetical protein
MVPGQPVGTLVRDDHGIVPGHTPDVPPVTEVKGRVPGQTSVPPATVDVFAAVLFTKPFAPGSGRALAT